ncbi:hypothetical protein PAPYR_12186 [Paratrimastix pyriformis]|uniref:Uncharacterized protein n=1 Tax=Paratrimastix pyriformis TaxID=342808 RepID=A0ABQ8U2A9_9EUKA|nr:hypothetical protein PAPYR_12186 [Paratrimastix pyriformis]
MASLVRQLFPVLPPARLVQRSWGHVVPAENVLGLVVSNGPSGAPPSLVCKQFLILGIGRNALSRMRRSPMDQGTDSWSSLSEDHQSKCESAVNNALSIPMDQGPDHCQKIIKAKTDDSPGGLSDPTRVDPLLSYFRGSIRIQIKFECALSSKNELYSRNLWLSSVAIQCHKEARKRQLSVDICSLVDFIAQHAPKDFSEHLSSYLFPTLTPFTIRVLDRYPELKSDPHYRSMRNSKSESRFPPPKPKNASVQPLTSKKVPDPPASDHAFAPPTPTPMVVQHSGHCESTPPPPPLKRSAPREPVPIRQLVPVVPLGATPETLDSGDPGPPQPRARRRRRR